MNSRSATCIFWPFVLGILSFVTFRTPHSAFRIRFGADCRTKVVLPHDLGFRVSLGIWSLGTWVFSFGAEFLTKAVHASQPDLHLFRRNEQLHPVKNGLSWKRGLAADDFVGNCGCHRRRVCLGKIPAAEIQPRAGHSLRLLVCQPVRAAELDGFSGAPGGTTSNHGQNALTPPLRSAET